MLKEEVENGIVEDYRKTLKEVGIPEGLLLDADVEIANSNGGTVKVDGVLFGIGKLRFAMYPHIECHFTNNLQETCIVTFIAEENSGVPVAAFNEPSDIKNDTVFDIKDLEKFIKSIKAGKIKAEVYLNEKKNLEASLANLTKLIEENGIKEGA